MIYHPRSSWEDPKWPVDATYRFRTLPGGDGMSTIPGSGFLLTTGTAPRLRWADITTVALHYTAADNLIDGDPGELASGIPGYLRQIQEAYARQRAYSIGYNWAVDWLGGIWELRGHDIKTAAHAPANGYATAVLCLVDGADTTTLAADESIRKIIRESQRLADKFLKVTGHGLLQGVATACPGAGIKLKLAAGTYNPNWLPTPPLPPEINPDSQPKPPSQEEHMPQLIQPTDSGQRIDPAQFAITGTFAEWISTEGRANSLVFLGAVEHAGIKGVVPAQPIGVDRGFLQYYTLIGQPPTYPPTWTGPKTSPADFAKWVS